MPFYPCLQCLLCILTLSMPSSQSPMWQLSIYLAATLCHFTPFATLCHLSLCATLSMSPTSLCRTISPSSKDDPAPLTIAPWFLRNCLFVNSKDKHPLQFPAVLFILKYQATSTVYFNHQQPKKTTTYRYLTLRCYVCARTNHECLRSQVIELRQKIFGRTSWEKNQCMANKDWISFPRLESELWDHNFKQVLVFIRQVLISDRTHDKSRAASNWTLNFFWWQSTSLPGLDWAKSGVWKTAVVVFFFWTVVHYGGGGGVVVVVVGGGLFSLVVVVWCIFIGGGGVFWLVVVVWFWCTMVMIWCW